MLEKAIEKRITAYVERELGGRCLKLGTEYVGFPDRTVVLPGGHAVFLEIKRQGGRASKLQKFWIDKLSELGFTAAIVYSFDEAKAVLDAVA